jgi:hypothetical protein
LLFSVLLLPIVVASYMSGAGGRPKRPSGEPAKWKLVLWGFLFLTGFTAVLLVPFLVRRK